MKNEFIFPANSKKVHLKFKEAFCGLKCSDRSSNKTPRKRCCQILTRYLKNSSKISLRKDQL